MPDVPNSPSRRPRHLLRGLLPIALGVLAAACGDAAAPPPVPSSLAPVSAAALSAPVGTALPVPAIVALDDEGLPLANVEIAFQVVEGGGAIARASVRTDAAGQADAGAWTLGTVAGRNVLSASAAGAAPLQIVATATAGPAASLTIVAGAAQTAYRGTAVAAGPAVQVADAYGNAVAGALVAFEVVEGGGSVEHPSAASDASGIAAAGAWRLGPDVGRNIVRARLGAGGGLGTGGSADFEATAIEPIAHSLVAHQGGGQSAAAGTAVAVAPAVRTLDAAGQPLPGVSVRFAAEAGSLGAAGEAAVTVLSDEAGIAAVERWILGTTVGVHTLTATATATPTVQASFAASAVAGTPAIVTAIAGEGQSAQAGQSLPIQPAVRVTDAHGNVVAGAAVTFEVTAGGGSIAPATTPTDADGVARALWRLGPIAGTNVLTARAGTGSASFAAIATAPPPPPTSFRIELRYLSTLTGTQQAAFDAAADRWSSIIIGDLPAVPINVNAGGCTPAMNEVIDDLVVFVRTAAIDGAGGTIASAGPCYVRSSGGMPAVGRITVDEADIANMLASGSLTPVVLHELGHVLGVGTDWNGGLVGNGGPDPWFTGTSALGEYVALGGSGPGVPVEATGGSGTAYAHWRESVFATELMTGWINVGRANPLSRITAGLLQDLGYVVALGAADAYQLPSAGLAGNAAALDEARLEIRELPMPPPQRIGPDGRPIR
jgi:Bacterial Ig-like domain (group 1)/Leishmanolysin